MSEFTAKIQAELDVSQVQAQLDALCKGKKIKIDIDTGKGKSGIDNVNSSLRNAQQSAQSLGDTIKHALGVGSAFAVAQKGVQLIEKAARNASEAIKDFDKNITNIRLALCINNFAIIQYFNRNFFIVIRCLNSMNWR